MTEYHWPDLYERATHLAKGDRPGIDLEGRIVERFAEDPERVERAIERIGASYARGDIRSFWSVLDTDLAAPAGPRFQTTATAKQPSSWIVTAEPWEPDLPPGPRVLPDFVRAWKQHTWPQPLRVVEGGWDGEEPPL